MKFECRTVVKNHLIVSWVDISLRKLCQDCFYVYQDFALDLKKMMSFPSQYCESEKPIRCSDLKVRFSVSWEAAWNIQRKVLSYWEVPTLYKVHVSHSLPALRWIVWYSNLNILSQIRLGPDIPFFESSEQERGL